MDFPDPRSIPPCGRGARQAGPHVGAGGCAGRSCEKAAEARQQDPAHDRRHHVGYYLISRGRFELEKVIGYPPTRTEHFSRFFFAHPAVGYLGTIAAMTGAGVFSLLRYADQHGADAARPVLDRAAAADSRQRTRHQRAAPSAHEADSAAAAAQAAGWTTSRLSCAR